MTTIYAQNSWCSFETSSDNTRTSSRNNARQRRSHPGLDASAGKQPCRASVGKHAFQAVSTRSSSDDEHCSGRSRRREVRACMNSLLSWNLPLTSALISTCCGEEGGEEGSIGRALALHQAIPVTARCWCWPAVLLPHLAATC